ncbi:MAG: hypothetical protein HYX97_03940 [Chloroflexi bacterium]|nr:hypothetical protein [Chloroflexota bacterium]
MRKTRLMKQVEERYQRPLEQLLPQMYNERGLPAMAEELGVSKGTLWYWLLKFGISVRRVAVSPNEELQVVRRNAS